MLLSLMAALTLAAPAADTVAIIDVSVLPMTGPRVLTHQTILVAGGRIVALGDTKAVRVPRDAQRIDGTGRFVLPGLADMHVHLSVRDEFPLFVGSGVLTVRDLNGSPEKLGWRDSIASRRMFGPRLIVSGPMIAGDGIPWSNKVVPRSAAEADSAVVAQKRAGYDQVKIYDGLSFDIFTAAMRAAKRVGMPSSGHIPQDVGFDRILASGMNGLEHLDKTVFATMQHNLDTLQVPSIVDRIKRSGMYVTPTLESMVQLAKVASGGYDSLMNRPEAQRAPSELRDFWTSVTSRLKGNRPLTPGVRYNPYADMQFRIAGALARAGVPLLTGTDLPNVVLVPGYSLHRELAVLVEAGLTPYQALEASTSTPARVFNQSSDWGTVEVGRRANLLMVDANPLSDLGTLRAPRTVLLNGVVYDDAQLRSMRDGHSPRVQ